MLTAPERRPSAALMAERLRAHGVTLDDSLVATVAGDPKRLNALHQLDFSGQRTAFEHLERLAAAQTLFDQKPAAPMVAELFGLAGDVTFATGRCYSRTNHSVYSAHHMGEMARLLTDLATTGRVKLASGLELTWDPRQLPVANTENDISWAGLGQKVTKHDHVNTLWAALNQNLVNQTVPNGAVLTGVAEQAYRGQMANVTSRLMGEQFVNVDGARARPHLNDLAFAYGPLLAEYGAHGGSVYEVTGTTASASWEGGRREPVTRTNLGYVVVPAEEAKARGLSPLDYADDNTNYVDLAAEQASRTTPEKPE